MTTPPANHRLAPRHLSHRAAVRVPLKALAVAAILCTACAKPLPPPEPPPRLHHVGVDLVQVRATLHQSLKEWDKTTDGFILDADSPEEVAAIRKRVAEERRKLVAQMEEMLVSLWKKMEARRTMEQRRR